MGTFGKTDIGGSSSGFSGNYKDSTNYQMAAVAGQRLKSIHVYCPVVGNNIRLAIYNIPGNTQTSDPGDLIWGSDSFTPSVGWNEIVIPEADRPALTASHWYALANKVSGTSIKISWDAGVADSGQYELEAFADPWDDPFGTPTKHNGQWSIYGEYEAIPAVAARSHGFILG